MPMRTPSHSIVVMRDGQRVRATPGKPFDFTADEIKELVGSDPLALVSDAPHGKTLEPQGPGPVIVSGEPSRPNAEPEPIREPVAAPLRQGEPEEVRRAAPAMAPSPAPRTAPSAPAPAQRQAPPATGRREGNL